MKRVPASRYLLVFAIAGGSLFWDLFSKSVVFDDLGYHYRRGDFELVEPGRNEIFTRPKPVAGQRLPFGESVPYLTGWMTFRLLTSFNEGALWGVGQGYSWAFAGMSVLATAAILYWLFVRKAAASLWLSIALAFVLGGTLGNLYDRTGLHGYTIPGSDERVFAVRDFLLFTFGNFSWPVFNFADTYLVTGAIMLVLQSFSAEVPAGEAKREPAPAEAAEKPSPA